MEKEVAIRRRIAKEYGISYDSRLMLMCQVGSTSDEKTSWTCANIMTTCNGLRI